MKKITLISILTIIIVVLLVIVLTACDNTVASTPNSFYSIENGNIDAANEITYYAVFVDRKTGIEYFYTWSSYKSAMTPRYKADGSLCVYGEAENG